MIMVVCVYVHVRFCARENADYMYYVLTYRIHGLLLFSLPPPPRYIYFLPLLISLVYHNEGLATALTLAPVVVALVFAVDCGVARRLDRATLADQGKPRAKMPALHFVGAWCLAVTIPVYLIFRGIVSRNWAWRGNRRGWKQETLLRSRSSLENLSSLDMNTAMAL